MATLLNVDRVKYVCTCGMWEPLCRLYFCRHCSTLRCRDCVTHEVDSIFCPTCLENMPTAEARVKKNRCGNCFECPACGHAMALRATSFLPPGVPPTTDPDQLNAILDQFRHMAAAEKVDRERKKYTKRRSHTPMFTDKYGLQALMARRRLGLAEKEQQLMEEISVEPTEDVDELPDSIFTEELRIDSATSVEQRHKAPLTQPPLAADLYPVKKPLAVRRSLRCKQCDHNLCKGEYNPSSIKFKIQLFALIHVPEIRLVKEPTLIAGQPCEVLLSLQNLTQALMHVVFLPNVEAENDPAFVKMDIPVTELTLPVRDETIELDDTIDQSNQYKDDPSIVTFRKGHKVGVRIFVHPEDVEHDLWLSFMVKYDYVNTVLGVGGEQKEPDIVWLHQTLKIRLGIPRKQED